MEEQNKGLTGSTLKWIAIVTMLIDHVGAAVLTRMLLVYLQNPGEIGWIKDNDTYVVVYYAMQCMRMIGRLAFPIFCFLLVEGFQRTQSIPKYALRMAGFALITEVPFDLAFSAQVVYWGYQNVMLTLLVGLLTMWGCREIEKRYSHKKVLLGIGYTVCVAAGMLWAQLMHTDYSWKGVACIMVLYFFRKDRLIQCIAGAISFSWEATAILSFFPLFKYNGQRGMKMKYFFYLFYPLHLLILYGVCVLFGIEWMSVV